MQETSKKIAVVILNWNGKKFLEKFLPSVIQYNSDFAEIIIADNASSDDSVAFLQNQYPNIRIIQNKKNFGFAGGYNEALKHVNTPYYLLLNSDIEVSPNWLEPLLQLMELDEKIAVCQPKLLSYYDKTAFEYAGAAGGFIDSLGYPFCRGRIFNNLEKDEHQYDQNCEIFWATGAAMMVRSDVYNTLGGLDKDFFAHMEEIDFCWRVKNKGYKVFYCAQSVAYHVGGGTLPKSSSRKTYLNFRNNFTLLYKNLPSNEIFKVFALRLILDGVAALKFLAGGNPAEFFAVTRAHFSFYRHFFKIRKKRKLCKPQMKLFQWYKGSIVFDHYVKKIQKFSELPIEKFR